MQQRALLPVLLLAIVCCSDAAPPEDAQSFEISLHGWACLDPCRQFGLSLDSSGWVHVHNPSGAPRLATFDLQVPAQAARDLYRDLLTSNFTQLLDRYSADGGTCAADPLDHKVSVLSLAAGSDYKQIVYRHACPGVQSDLDKLIGFEQALRELTAIDRLLSSAPSTDCEIDGRSLSFAPVYTIRDPDATGVGFLRFTNTATQRRFIVQGCSGDELTQGSVSIDSACSAQLLVDPDKPKRWLGTNEALSSIFVDGSGGEDTLAFLAVRRSSDADVAAQVGLLGASCEGGPSDDR